MNKLLSFFLVSALAATAGCAATGSSAERTTARGTYYWLHPKLGMVKVDGATNAMVTGQRRAADGADTGRGTQPSR